ncbi:hypothetical protein ED208_07385 [Stagnimonas aquatica]|uniref:Uncharacterized protein n=1 Tax=Stagnimonas aquatica TaxID=2689987 RepID=A0A3N0VDL3_9GAMM|nr:hypothetical protein ED208_07385 [Stagnimonas aquatica]
MNSAADAMRKAAMAVRAYERQVIAESRVCSLPRERGRARVGSVSARAALAHAGPPASARKQAEEQGQRRRATP